MKTILYYTSNRENPEFEEKIVKKLKQNCGKLPIISISQKPMDLGKNVCIGDVGHSYLNLYRQQLIGAKLAETEYLVLAESDFIYPPEYFKFEPDGDSIYLYNNILIMFHNKRSRFFRKNISHGCQIVKTKSLIDRLEKYLKGMPQWFNGHPSPWLNTKQLRKISLPEYKEFSGKEPAISFKTGAGINYWTKVMNSNTTKNGGCFGSFNNIKKEFFNET